MTDPPFLLAGALADRYRIERELGQGGMATVYLAHDIRHDRKVALKVLKAELGVTLDAERFLAEIRTTARLQHPNILPLFDSGSVTSREGREGRDAESADPATPATPATVLYYVMPFVEGESLRDRLTRVGKLSVDDALVIAREVADALDHAHRAGIVHRDIKPENILLSGRHAVVADFGIARALESDGAERLTRTGHVIGTPAYLSPEQVTGEPLDGRSDLYSLGCVLYECLAGELPFAGPGMAMLAQRVIAPAPSVRGRRPEVAAQVDRAILRAMATLPADRFATGADFAAALAASPGAQGPERRAIVVLPFENRSADPENEYFSDGLTEEIISDLAGIKSLQVTSRTSAMQLKGTTKDVRTIGRELGVRYLLEGSVRRSGNALRITAQLIDAASDSQVWSEKYSGTLDDVFEVQERVAREIVKALGVTLTASEDARLAHRSIENVQAFELYLQARQELRRYGGAAIARAETLTRRAMEIEGETPPLRALIALADVARVRGGSAQDSRLLERPTAIAQDLIAATPDMPHGHLIMGIIGYERGRLADAIRHLEAALEREPNDADALFYLGVCYVGAGLVEHAADVGRRLMSVDPLSPLAWMVSGIVTWWTGHAADGIAMLERSVEMDPTNAIGRWTLGYAYALVGDTASAARHAEFLRRETPDLPYTAQLVALVHGMEGRQAEARAALEGVSGLDAHHRFHLAEACAMAGDADRALGLLEEAVHGGFHPGEFIALHCPFFESLRGLPRFRTAADASIRLTREFAAAEAAA